MESRFIHIETKDGKGINDSRHYCRECNSYLLDDKMEKDLNIVALAILRFFPDYKNLKPSDLSKVEVIR